MIGNAEDVDIVMPIYDLLDYSKNYSMASGRLWTFYRDEVNGAQDYASDSKWFKYKTKILGKTSQTRSSADGSQLPQLSQPGVPFLDEKVTIIPKYFRKFSRFSDLPLINWNKMEFDIK